MPGYDMLMNPNKDETAVHGCHCPSDVAVCMRKVLAIPHNVPYRGDVLIILQPYPQQGSIRLVVPINRLDVGYNQKAYNNGHPWDHDFVYVITRIEQQQGILSEKLIRLDFNSCPKKTSCP